MGIGKPCHVNLVGTLYLMAVRIDTETLLEENFSVGALSARNKNNHIMAGGKLSYVRHPVGYLTTDGIETAEDSVLRYMLLDIVNDGMELVEVLGSLTIQINVMCKVELRFGIIKILNDYGVTISLTDQAQHLGMTILTEYDYLCFRIHSSSPSFTEGEDV